MGCAASSQTQKTDQPAAAKVPPPGGGIHQQTCPTQGYPKNPDFFSVRGRFPYTVETYK